ncbi:MULTISPECIES: hypothetical protein [unclassified Variovorax]|uniref:hypothetical protein n=1 Tax=unclassified Variovorax TaxID=663243 RepID=UPI003ECDB085
MNNPNNLNNLARAAQGARGHNPRGIVEEGAMVDWAEKFAAEMLRLTEGHAAYNDMLDWGLGLWPAQNERDPAEVARGEFRNAVDDD